MKKSSFFIFIVFSLGVFASGVWASSKFTDVPLNHWANDAINHVQSLGLMKGDENKNTFRPDEAVSRAETAVILDRMDDYMKDYVHEYVNQQIGSAISAFEKVLESPVHDINPEKNTEGWTEFKSEKLGLSFKLPDYLKNCDESEVILDELPVFEGLQQEGRKMTLNCGDLKLTARTEIYKPYEDYYVPYASMPEPYEMQESCLSMMTEDCVGYKLKLKDGKELFFVAYQGEPSFYVGTYVPIQINKYYKTVRLTMLIQNNEAKDKWNEDMVKKTLKNIIERNLDEASLKRLEDFEQIVMSANSI